MRSTDVKARSAPDFILETLRAEIQGGTEAMSSWMKHLQAKDEISNLFEFEIWLRSLNSFFDLHHLPMEAADRAAIMSRSFAWEIRVARLAIQQCESAAVRLAGFGNGMTLPAESAASSRVLTTGKLHSQIGDALMQSTPMDSLNALLEFLDDLGCSMDALVDQLHQDLKLYLGFGRTFSRNLRHCRYMELLIAQRFRPEYDRVDNAVLSGVLRSIPDEKERRNFTVALLYLHRFLRYLALVSRALENDRPLRAYLAIFSLLHEQADIFCEFLRTRLLQGRGDARRQNAADLVIHSSRMAMERVFERELPSLACLQDASVIYTKMENAHGLLRNCYQNAMVILVQAVDEEVDPQSLFPAMLEGMQQGQKLIRDLWRLRQALRQDLEKATGLKLSSVLERIGQFREESLRLLMYQDWGEFEQCSEKLITAGSEIEARALLRKFVSFLEFLIQEVSKRSVLK